MGVRCADVPSAIIVSYSTLPRPDDFDCGRVAMLEAVWRASSGEPARMRLASALDQHTEPGLGAQFDAVAIGVVDIEGLLTIVPGLDLGGDYPSADHVLMGRSYIVHLKGRVV